MGQIEIEWVSRAEPGKWVDLISQLGFDPAPTTLPEALATQNAVVTIVALPDDLGLGSRFLSGQVELAPLKGEEARWLLRLAVVRDLSPPADVVESSRSIGGYPGVLSRI